MKKLWSDRKTLNFFKQFGVDCLYYQARLSPELRFGVTKLSSSAIHGYKYANPQAVSLIRTSISYKIINSEFGRIFEGGARFSIAPVYLLNGVITRNPVYDSVFKGDVIVVKNKPIRDFDVLTKGSRDTLFAFDVKSVLSVSSVGVDGTETLYTQGIDFKITFDGADAAPADMPVVSVVAVVWLNGGAAPRDGQDYNVEFMCSPNYVIWDDLAHPRATEESDLPKMVMSVKRAFFNKITNAIDGVKIDSPVLNTQNALDEDY